MLKIKDSSGETIYVLEDVDNSPSIIKCDVEALEDEQEESKEEE